MNRLHEPAAASSSSNDQLVEGQGRAGNTRRKGCLEILGLHNWGFLLIKCILWLFPFPLLTIPPSCPVTGGPALPVQLTEWSLPYADE